MYKIYLKTFLCIALLLAVFMANGQGSISIVDQISNAMDYFENTESQRVYLRGKRASSAEYGISVAAGSHIQGMTVSDDRYYFTYSDWPGNQWGNILGFHADPSEYDDVTRVDLFFDGKQPYGISDPGWASGIQANGQLMVVGIGGNNTLAFFNCEGEKPYYIDKIDGVGNIEPVGMVNEKDAIYYVVTPSKLLKLGLSSSNTINSINNPAISLSKKLVSENGGFALFSDGIDDNKLACLVFSDHYKVDLYSIDKKSGIVEFKKSITLLGHIHTFETPSFRYGGSARINDGQLEIFVAPRRLDAGLQGSSDVYKWTAPIINEIKEKSIGTEIKDDDRIFLKSSNGYISMGRSRNTLSDVTHLSQHKQDLFQIMTKDKKGTIHYGDKVMFFTDDYKTSSDQKVTSALSDGEHWTTYLRTFDETDSDQIWKIIPMVAIDGVPGFEPDRAVKSGDMFLISKFDKPDVLLYAKDDGVLSLSTKKGEVSIWTITGSDRK